MASMAAIYRVLSRASTTAADEALLAALPGAEAAGMQAIVDTLLVRHTQAGLRGLIAHFHEFDEALKRRVLGETDEVFRVLRSAAQSREYQVRLNVIEIIQRGQAYRASYLLDAALHDRSAAVREAAATALYGLADKLYRTRPVPSTNEELAAMSPDEIEDQMLALETYREDRRQVVSALDSGLNSFNIHLHPRVIEAATWFVDDLGMRFWSLVSTPGSKASHVAGSILGETLTPRLATFAFLSMNFSGFRRLVVNAMAQCRDPEFLAAWLREGWRLSQVRLARAMVTLKELACVKDRAVLLMQLPPDVLRHAPRWIALTGLPAELKVVVLRELARSGHREVRRAAVSALVTQPADLAISPLRTLAGSDDTGMATMARLHLARFRPTEFSLTDLLSRALGQQVEPPRKAQPEEQLSFDDYWASFDDLSDNDRRTLGQQILASVPQASAIIGRKLTSPEPRNRVRALRMASLLDLAGNFSEPFYQLSFDPDAEVRSAAIAALSHLPTATSQRIIRSALNDEDQRVRANAVEAVEATGDTSIADKLLPMLTSKDNRVRANAVKALLKLGVRQAAETLLRMLNDKNRAHRISALWLIENMGLFSLATRVVVMADVDEDEQVRGRAQRLSDLLASQPAEAEPQEVAT